MGLLLLAAAGTADALTGTVAYVASGGGTASNAAFRTFGSVGVGGGFEQLSASFIGRNGALFSFLMDPARDNDGDGIADEDDPDDDNDGLKDGREILGDAFDPPMLTPTDSMCGDTDGDGASDADEARAGSNPLDPAAFLRILDGRRQGGNWTIQWEGRQTWIYEVLSATDMTVLAQSPVVAGVATSPVGAGPWQVATTAFTNAAPAAQTYYRIRLKP